MYHLQCISGMKKLWKSCANPAMNMMVGFQTFQQSQPPYNKNARHSIEAQFVEICSNLYLSVAISTNLQKYIGIFRHLQQSVEAFRGLQRSLAIFSDLQHFTTICSNFQQYLQKSVSIFSYLQLSVTISKNRSQSTTFCHYFAHLNTLSIYCHLRKLVLQDSASTEAQSNNSLYSYHFNSL